jgi:hypothetical protein
LTEEQQGELTLKVSFSDSAARGIAGLAEKVAPKPAVSEIGVSSTIGGAKARAAPDARAGASRAAMLGVALLSAAVAGGSAYFFARGPAPASVGATAAIAVEVQVLPPDARVSTAAGAVPVVGGVATLRGKPGETLSVTVQHGSSSKIFPVSIGSDGVASPGRLVLVP